MARSVTVTALACAYALASLAGCATGPKGPSDEEFVMQQVQAFVDDFLAGNVDNMLGYVSEDFSHERVPDKASLAGYIEMGKASGRVAEIPQMIEEHDGQIDLEMAEVVVEGDTASVYPIEASADAGSVTVEMVYKKDPDGVWRILALNIEGI